MPHPRDGNEEGRGHPPQGGTVRAREAGYDARDLALLEVMRMFFMSFSDPGRQAWERAFDRCEFHFGAGQAGTVGLAALRTLQAMRLSRKTTFRFSNPFCPCCRDRLTDCERNLLGVLHALSHNDGTTARANALVLCEGFPAGDFLAAAAALVALRPSLRPADVRH